MMVMIFPEIDETTSKRDMEDFQWAHNICTFNIDSI